MTPYAVDSTVLSELLLGAPRAAEAALALERVLDVGVIASVWVAAEILAISPDQAEGTAILGSMGVIADYDINEAILRQAAGAWRIYLNRGRHGRDTFSCPGCGVQQEIPACMNCGQQVRGPRRLLTDFLIGAHAIQRAQALITWDRGIYTTYFPGLRLIEPGAAPGG